MSFAVRNAEPADVDRVWQLVKELAEYERLSHTVSGSAEQLRHHLFEPGSCGCYVAVLNGEIIGYAIFFRSFSTFRAQPGLWLEDLYVTPSMRGNGYGKALLVRLIEDARQFGHGRLEWSVLDWKEPSIEFYRSMGAEMLPDWRICRMSF
jgi:GNAT superfamily N-acetyltransferase